MITGTEMYWLTRLTSLKESVTGVGVGIILLFGMLGSMALLGWVMEDSKSGKKWLMRTVPITILGMLIAASSAFIPTTKEMCAIKAIPMIVNNEQAQELPGKVLELAGEWIEELKPKAQEGE